MHFSARIPLAVFFFILILSLFTSTVSAQSAEQSTPISAQTTSTSNNFLTPNNVESNVPIDHHSYSQIALIDIFSAFMCQMAGIDPTNPQQSCLGVNPLTGKIGLAPTTSPQAFGQAQSSQPQVGGAVGVMVQFVSSLYVPAVSSKQYFGYLADNFGIVHPTYAAGTATNGNCSTSPFGYGFCGLTPIFSLWHAVLGLAYALLTLLFSAIGIAVMVRFRIDPRTVMTLQNQIPRVVIAIFLITFSYAIAGGMIDLMWTATYAGINFISNASNSQVALNCPQPPTPLSQNVEQRLLDQPISFTNTIFRADCNGSVDNGILSLADKVSSSFGDLVHQILNDFLVNVNSGCTTGNGFLNILNPAHDVQCLANGVLGSFLIWFTEQLVKIIIVIAILVALFRLWFKLIQAYLTFIIFVIMGPIWIVLGLIPGRPMGFEKWLRIIFANLAVFPLVAFILVFARVIVDAVPHSPGPQNVFIPPLVGNPNISTFSDLIGFGAIMLAPTIPDLIKERMKATGQAKYGAAIGASIGAGANAATAIPAQGYKHLNKRDQYGNAVGAIARGKDVATSRVATRVGSMPGLGWVQRQHEMNEEAKLGPQNLGEFKDRLPAYKSAQKNDGYKGTYKAWVAGERARESVERLRAGQPDPTASPTPIPAPKPTS